MKVTVTPNDSNGKIQHIEREIVNGELIQVWYIILVPVWSKDLTIYGL